MQQDLKGLLPIVAFISLYSVHCHLRCLRVKHFEIQTRSILLWRVPHANQLVCGVLKPCFCPFPSKCFGARSDHIWGRILFLSLKHNLLNSLFCSKWGHDLENGNHLILKMRNWQLNSLGNCTVVNQVRSFISNILEMEWNCPKDFFVPFSHSICHFINMIYLICLICTITLRHFWRFCTVTEPKQETEPMKQQILNLISGFLGCNWADIFFYM